MKTKRTKQKEAKKRQQSREVRSSADQINLLSKRPGDSKKEIERLKHDRQT